MEKMMESLADGISNELLPSQAKVCFETLEKVLGNIEKNPGEAKFRSLKKENKMVKENLLKAQSSQQLLLILGFEDDGDVYRLPMDADMTALRACLELLRLRKQQLLRPQELRRPLKPLLRLLRRRRVSPLGPSRLPSRKHSRSLQPSARRRVRSTRKRRGSLQCRRPKPPPHPRRPLAQVPLPPPNSRSRQPLVERHRSLRSVSKIGRRRRRRGRRQTRA